MTGIVTITAAFNDTQTLKFKANELRFTFYAAIIIMGATNIGP